MEPQILIVAGLCLFMQATMGGGKGVGFKPPVLTTRATTWYCLTFIHPQGTVAQ